MKGISYFVQFNAVHYKALGVLKVKEMTASENNSAQQIMSKQQGTHRTNTISSL